MSHRSDVLSRALELSHEDRRQVMLALANSLGAGPQSPNHPGPTVEALTGDITRVPVEIMITPINSAGRWGVVRDATGVAAGWKVNNESSLDAAIFRVAGPQYHQQARQLIGADEGETLIAARQKLHQGFFGQVLFVVDNGNLPLAELVGRALAAADRAGLSSVALPLIRTGAGARDGITPTQKVGEIVRAAQCFRGMSLQTIHLVAGTTEIGALLERALAGSGPKICLMLGDITAVDSDALITAVNSEGFWSGGVDRAVYASSGTQFHEQASPLLGQSEGTVLLASSQTPHNGAFRQVAFVVDDLRLPLYDVLSAGLDATDQAGLRSVTIPAMRMGVMMDLGGSPEEKIRDMARAVKDFRSRAQNVTTITFVIYGDPITFEALRRELREVSDAPSK